MSSSNDQVKGQWAASYSWSSSESINGQPPIVEQRASSQMGDFDKNGVPRVLQETDGSIDEKDRDRQRQIEEKNGKVIDVQ